MTLYTVQAYYSDDCTYSYYKTLATFTDELVAIGVCENLRRQMATRASNCFEYPCQGFELDQIKVDTSTDLDEIHIAVIANSLKKDI